MIPRGGAVRRGGEHTAQAAREVIAAQAGNAGGLAFDAIAQAMEWTTLVRRGKRFTQLNAEAQRDELRRWARNEWTRWPFLVFSGLLKAAHFDNAEHFERFGVPFDRSGRAEDARWLRQVRGPQDVEEGERIACDVVVIGTGAGGAVVGAELAKQGYAVVFVEEGGVHRRDEFSGRALPSHRRFFRHGTVALGNTAILRKTNREKNIGQYF